MRGRGRFLLSVLCPGHLESSNYVCFTFIFLKSVIKINILNEIMCYLFFLYNFLCKNTLANIFLINKI